MGTLKGGNTPHKIVARARRVEASTRQRSQRGSGTNGVGGMKTPMPNIKRGRTNT